MSSNLTVCKIYVKCTFNKHSQCKQTPVLIWIVYMIEQKHAYFVVFYISPLFSGFSIFAVSGERKSESILISPWR